MTSSQHTEWLHWSSVGWSISPASCILRSHVQTAMKSWIFSGFFMLDSHCIHNFENHSSLHFLVTCSAEGDSLSEASDIFYGWKLMKDDQFNKWLPILATPTSVVYVQANKLKKTDLRLTFFCCTTAANCGKKIVHTSASFKANPLPKSLWIFAGTKWNRQKVNQ